MALGLFGSRVRPGGRGGIYSTMDGLGAGPAASTVTTRGTSTPGYTLVTADPAVIDAAFASLPSQAAASSISPILVAGGLAVAGYFVYRHFKKKGG